MIFYLSFEYFKERRFLTICSFTNQKIREKTRITCTNTFPRLQLSTHFRNITIMGGDRCSKKVFNMKDLWLYVIQFMINGIWWIFYQKKKMYNLKLNFWCSNKCDTYKWFDSLFFFLSMSAGRQFRVEFFQFYFIKYPRKCANKHVKNYSPLSI